MASSSQSRSRANSTDDFDEIELIDVPNVIKSLPKLKQDPANSSIRAIEEMIHDVSKDEAIQVDNFACKE